MKALSWRATKTRQLQSRRITGLPGLEEANCRIWDHSICFFPACSAAIHHSVRVVLRFIAVLLALVQTWNGRFYMDPDGTAYADIARAWLRGDWGLALNGYWSPLYS